MKRGLYYQKKEYSDQNLYSYEEIKDKLPLPILTGRGDWLNVYKYALKILFQNQHIPTSHSGFVSNFVDAAFNENIFLWDTAFMTLFCNLLHPYIPGIRSLDNFYAKQYDDGEIPREMVRETGEDFLSWVNTIKKPLYSYFHNHYGHRRLKGHEAIEYEAMYKPDLGRPTKHIPYLTLDNLNHPILAFAEWESYLQTGDYLRLHKIIEPLYMYYKAFKEYLQHQNSLYITDWASMDNSPRNAYLGFAIDTSSEMVLFGRRLILIIDEIIKYGLHIDLELSLIREEVTVDVEQLSKRINEKMWDDVNGFYYDLNPDEEYTGIKTVAGFWPLISEVADKEKSEKLVEWLNDKRTFNRKHRVPSLAADEEGYDPEGGYWRGSVWAPTNTMVVLGLEKSGHHKLAKDIALNHLDAITKVFMDTGTIWENYPADSFTSGNSDKKDFVGWSGIGPIYFLLRYGVGLHADSSGEYLIWNLYKEDLEKGEVGCENYWFQGVTSTLKAWYKDGKIHITVRTTGTLKLKVRYSDRINEYLVESELSATMCEIE